jgi:hypothetical protein
LVALTTCFLAAFYYFLRDLTAFLRAAILAFNFFFSALPLTSISFYLAALRSPLFLINLALIFWSLA